MRRVKQFGQFLNELKKGPSFTRKDTARILDMIDKADGDDDKLLAAAQRMANSITDPEKALARCRAAEEENYHDVAEIFMKKAKELGIVLESFGGLLGEGKVEWDDIVTMLSGIPEGTVVDGYTVKIVGPKDEGYDHVEVSKGNMKPSKLVSMAAAVRQYGWKKADFIAALGL